MSNIFTFTSEILLHSKTTQLLHFHPDHYPVVPSLRQCLHCLPVCSNVAALLSKHCRKSLNKYFPCSPYKKTAYYNHVWGIFCTTQVSRRGVISLPNCILPAFLFAVYVITCTSLSTMNERTALKNQNFLIENWQSFLKRLSVFPFFVVVCLFMWAVKTEHFKVMISDGTFSSFPTDNAFSSPPENPYKHVFVLF